MQLDDIRDEAKNAAIELLEKASLSYGQTVVVGCSTSEISGVHIGKCSNAELGVVVFEALYGVFAEKGVYMAAQCCEHLNRAIVIERIAAAGYVTVNAIPKPGAGGAFAAAAYSAFHDPVVIEEISADAGLDIGGTLIGMHIKKVAVPLRLDTAHIGKAAINAARARPKLIGGARAVYDESLF